MVTHNTRSMHSLEIRQWSLEEETIWTNTNGRNKGSTEGREWDDSMRDSRENGKWNVHVFCTMSRGWRLYTEGNFGQWEGIHLWERTAWSFWSMESEKNESWNVAIQWFGEAERGGSLLSWAMVEWNLLLLGDLFVIEVYWQWIQRWRRGEVSLVGLEDSPQVEAASESRIASCECTMDDVCCRWRWVWVLFENSIGMRNEQLLGNANHLWL